MQIQRYNPHHPDLYVLQGISISLHVSVATAADILNQFEYDVRMALKKNPLVVICQGRIITSSNYLNENCEECNLRTGCKEYSKFERGSAGNGDKGS